MEGATQTMTNEIPPEARAVLANIAGEKKLLRKKIILSLLCLCILLFGGFVILATMYVSLIRGTPLLVQVYMWYLALPQFGGALQKLGIPGAQKIFTIPAIPAGVLALGVCYGAYMTEIVRAGIESIKIGQTEAAKALGMNDQQCMRRIIFPQALRVILPPISNEFIAMVKDSSLVSLMGVWELSYRAIKIGRRYFQSLEMLIMVALIYWVMCIILQTVQERIEKHMARGERGNQ